MTCFGEDDSEVLAVGTRWEGLKPGKVSFADWLEIVQNTRKTFGRIHPEEHRCIFLEFLEDLAWEGDIPDLVVDDDDA